jgi:hypothetical protein
MLKEKYVCVVRVTVLRINARKSIENQKDSPSQKLENPVDCLADYSQLSQSPI